MGGGATPAVLTLSRQGAQVADGPETPGWDYAEIDTGHWPMFTKPVELAALLDALPVIAH